MTHFLASETKELWPVMLDCVSGELCVGNFSVNSGELGVEQKLHRVVKEKNFLGYWPSRNIPDTADFRAQMLESIGHQIC